MNQIQAGLYRLSDDDVWTSHPRQRAAGGATLRVATPLPRAVEARSKVAILLCTYHGQHYLAEQLDSFARQSHGNWKVWASDDGSKDNTHAILEAFQRKWPGRVSVNAGPAAGFAANFLSLTCNPDIEADFYAYSDQDDVWEADKLERAVQWLETVPAHIPALYCARTLLVDADNKDIGLSPLFSRPPSFGNALIQSIAGGNTMVFNNAARALLRKAGENVPVITHDWWAYQVVTGCGGKVFYDTVPTLRYRQHGNNIVGMNTSWGARFKRIRMLWEGRMRKWNDGNIRALLTLSDHLTPENREALERFAAGRQMGLIPRLIQLKRSGIRRQTLMGNLGLLAGVIFSKI